MEMLSNLFMGTPLWMWLTFMVAVLTLAANLLGLPEPPRVLYEDAEMTPMARSFYAENKRVRNGRIKAELGVRLRYPTYREGLAGLLANEKP